MTLTLQLSVPVPCLRPFFAIDGALPMHADHSCSMEASGQPRHRLCSSDRCESKMKAANQLLSTRLQDFQERIQRCGARCQDQATDGLGSSPSEAQIKKAQVPPHDASRQSALSRLPGLTSISCAVAWGHHVSKHTSSEMARWCAGQARNMRQGVHV